MNKVLRNIFAVLTGIIIGSIVNMTLITISGSIIPPPEGADLTTMEALKESMHLFTPKNFIFPFLAHALGTFVGALLAGFIAITYKIRFAMSIGYAFLLGGIINVFMLPSPVWFSVLDIVVAYLPMAYFAGKIATRNNSK